MVILEAADIIPLRDFELAWRITDERWAALPESVLGKIKALSSSRARELWTISVADLAGLAGGVLDLEPLPVTRERSLEASGALDDEECRAWFRGLPIEADDLVYLCWSIGEGVAAVTNWGTFLANWEDLWYPFDELRVFDETREWAVMFGPEEVARYAEKVAGPVVA